jgi:hypothetical protein
MGSSRTRNSTRPARANSFNRTKATEKLRRAAANRRHPTAAAVSLPQKRNVGDPQVRHIGTELRDVAARLKRIEAYLIVAGGALDASASHSGYVVVLLRSAVGNLLFKQIRILEDLAARCDGGPSSDRDQEDDPAYDEDSNMDAEDSQP